MMKKKVIYKVCFKANHMTLQCWHEFDYSYQAKQIPQVLAAVNMKERTS